MFSLRYIGLAFFSFILLLYLSLSSLGFLYNQIGLSFWNLLSEIFCHHIFAFQYRSSSVPFTHYISITTSVIFTSSFFVHTTVVTYFSVFFRLTDPHWLILWRILHTHVTYVLQLCLARVSAAYNVARLTTTNLHNLTFLLHTARSSHSSLTVHIPLLFSTFDRTLQFYVPFWGSYRKYTVEKSSVMRKVRKRSSYLKDLE